MVDLAFAVEGAEAERYALTPTILFNLGISCAAQDVTVENVQLNCQIRIEAARRSYTAPERERLAELFGESHRWKDTVQSMLWAHASAQVPAIGQSRIVSLPVPCTFDFHVAATKYFYGLEDSRVPLLFLFSGTVFYRDRNGSLQMEMIPWRSEASYQFPVRLWREMMDLYYPNTAWLCIRREVFDEICRYKRQCGFTSWDETLNALLALRQEERVP
jgi:hypothetical protein